MADPTGQQAAGALLTRVTRLRERGIALTQQLDDADAAAELEKVIRSVAFRPDPAHLQATIAIGYALEDAGAHGTLRRLSAMLACTYPFTELASAVTEVHELWAVVLHEYVLRGNDLRAYAERLHGHPLGTLPLALLDCELRISPASYRESGVGRTLPFGPSRAPAPTYAPLAHALEPAHTSMAPSLSLPFATWVAHSNATVDAVVLEFEAPQDVSAIHPENLRALGVASLSGLRLLRPTSLDAVCAQLFAAAAYGGAHDGGVGGAYGRLAMWQSIAALAGVPLTTVPDVSAHAAACTWWYYDGTPWFAAVAWDLGLIALRADRRSMAVLAATDTD